MYHINKLIDKNYIIISIDAEKAFNKIQNPFMIKKKNSSKNGHRRNLPQHDKGHVQETTANIVLSGEKLKAFLPRSGIRQECPLSPLLFKIVLEVLAMAIREEI